MPELPEVEVIRLGLSKKITGLSIKKIKVLNPKSFQGDPSAVVGLKITKIWRRAKMLGIDLMISRSKKSKTSLRGAKRRGNLITLLFHLKMSGQIIYQSLIGGHPTKDMLGKMPSKSTRVIITFEKPVVRNQNPEISHLYFNDQRKFGWIKLVNTAEVTNNKLISNLGPEPLEKSFTAEVLKTQLQRRKKTTVKVALLDQQLIAGIGNIYACESCFIAGINPKKLVKDLKDKDYQRLLIGIKESLLKSIKYGGSSKQHYFNASGKKGYFLDVAFVYDRKGKPCRICQTPIEKIKLGGRGTYLCPSCQSL